MCMTVITCMLDVWCRFTPIIIMQIYTYHYKKVKKRILIRYPHSRTVQYFYFAFYDKT